VCALRQYAVHLSPGVRLHHDLDINCRISRDSTSRRIAPASASHQRVCWRRVAAPPVARLTHSTASAMLAREPSQAAISLLLSALKNGNSDIAEYPEEFLVAVAEMLTENLVAAPNSTKRVRSLAYNLQHNHLLRRELLSEVVTPAQLCAMDASQWAPATIKRAREAAAERTQAELRRAATGGELWSQTRSVRCPECGGNRARFTYLGTDQKDWHGRKNEVWGTKHDDGDDGLDCQIVCSACHHSWHSAAPEVYEEEGDDLEQSRRKDLVRAGGNDVGTVHRRL
jgi:hypothetical protein